MSDSIEVSFLFVFQRQDGCIVTDNSLEESESCREIYPSLNDFASTLKTQHKKFNEYTHFCVQARSDQMKMITKLSNLKITGYINYLFVCKPLIKNLESPSYYCPDTNLDLMSVCWASSARGGYGYLSNTDLFFVTHHKYAFNSNAKYLTEEQWNTMIRWFKSTDVYSRIKKQLDFVACINYRDLIRLMSWIVHPRFCIRYSDSHTSEREHFRRFIKRMEKNEEWNALVERCWNNEESRDRVYSLLNLKLHHESRQDLDPDRDLTKECSREFLHYLLQVWRCAASWTHRQRLFIPEVFFSENKRLWTESALVGYNSMCDI